MSSTCSLGIAGSGVTWERATPSGFVVRVPAGTAEDMLESAPTERSSLLRLTDDDGARWRVVSRPRPRRHIRFMRTGA